jgi:hypothetical protein
MNHRSIFVTLRLAALLLLLGIGCYASAQTTQYLRPTAYSNDHPEFFCGGENDVYNTASMAGVYTGRSGAGPILPQGSISYAVLGVSGDSSYVEEGNQTATNFSDFQTPTGSGTVTGITVNFSMFAVNAACANIRVSATTTTGGNYDSGVTTIGPGAACQSPSTGSNSVVPGCTFTLPANTVISSITVYVAVRVPYKSTAPAELVMYDLWADYTTSS